MHNPIQTLLSMRTILLLLLAGVSFTTSATASPTPDSTEGTGSINVILSRQAAAPLAVPEACAQYSRVANLSAIGANATIRSAFLEASPVGTLFNAALLNRMQQAAGPLARDAQLNQACGNLTAVALQQVGVNFSAGIVGQFAVAENPVSIVSGPIVCVVTALALVVLLVPASAM